MNKFWTVFNHTFLSKVKAKSFIITTAIFLLFIIVIANLPTIISMFDGDESESKDRIAVLTQEDQLVSTLNERLEVTDETITLEQADFAEEDIETVIREEEYAGVLVIQPSETTIIEPIYYTTENQWETEMLLEQLLQQIKVELATNQAGIDQAIVTDIYQPIPFQTELISKETGVEAKSEEQLSSTRGLVYVILFLLYFAVITYGNMIAMDIANEKTSRVMEILISSSSPTSQMFAKILAIGAVGLSQMSLFLAVGYAVILNKKDELEGGFFEYFGLSDIELSTFIYAIVFFLLGYFLYATMAAMLGSLVSRTEDVQQMMMPVILLIVAAFMIAMFGLSTPNSQLVTISSFIPFFSPMTMFLRVGMVDVGMWEIALSIGILVLSIAILAILAARIYRGGVLMYGTSTSLKDFKKALLLSKK
ncbi:ABC transporter permease [Gracilibacillus marinus]|uniref:ABC transporter permease n=1 Tax=Gracilibacillus marinus TaxID=630535 RepID=A0ABV8VVW1_9BACI